LDNAHWTMGNGDYISFWDYVKNRLDRVQEQGELNFKIVCKTGK